MEESCYISPPKKPIVFVRTNLSISNEESCLVRSKHKINFTKEMFIFVYEHKIFEFIWIITHNSKHITLLNVCIIKGKC